MSGQKAEANRRSDVPSVAMGEIAVARGEQPLKCLLGSCIGLVLFHQSSGVGGLAHIVLPTSNGHMGPPGKFVDTAIPELIRRIEEFGGSQRQLAAKLAGGARMFPTESAVSVGDRNLAAIEEHLAQCRIPIVGRHCGGTSGRRITFYPGSGRVAIEIVGSESIDI